MRPAGPAKRISPSERLRIAVLGYIVRRAVRRNGLAPPPVRDGLEVELGHDVLFVEDSDDYASCYDPERRVIDIDPSYGLRFANESFGWAGLRDSWAYHDAHAGRWHGPRAGDARRFCATADLVLNLSGATPLRPWMMDAPARALVDTDPELRPDPPPHRPGRQGTHDPTHGPSSALARTTTLGRSAVPDDGFPW